MERTIDIAGLGLRVRFHGEDMPMYGYYTDSIGPEAGVIDIHLDRGLRSKVPATPNFPAFQCRQETDHSVRLRRSDAEGVIRYSEGEAVHAEFSLDVRAVALEALIRITSAFCLPQHEGLVMHSSAIADSRGAHVFSGVSGAGKSTIAAMLTEHWPVELLSDELLILRKIDGRWHTVVSPFVGSGGLDHGKATPLSSINLLRQASQHQRVPLRPGQALPEFCRHILTYAQGGVAAQQVLDLAADLVQSVPCYELRFAKNPKVGEALELAH